MISRIVFTGMFIFAFITFCSAQNFSGLQNKKLVKAEDLGSALESLIGRLGGSVDGSIDSVVVIQDYEKEIRLKIYYTDFVNGYFTVSTMTENRQRESQVEIVKFSQPDRNSPAECVLRLNSAVPKEALQESPYLRIDIAKRPDGGGKVKVFSLRKKWKMEGGPSASNMLIRVVLQPVGVAAKLDPTSDNGVMPAKNIRFKKALLNTTDEKIRIKPPVKTSGGNSFSERFTMKNFYLFDDVSGTWLNKVTTPNGYNMMIITNNNHITLYKRYGSSRSTPVINTPLATLSPTQFRAQYTGDGKAETVNTTSVLDLTLININEMAVKITSRIKTFLSTTNKTENYTFQRQIPIQPKQIDPIIYGLGDWVRLEPQKNPPGGPPPTDVRGPGNVSFYLWDGIKVDDLIDFNNPQEISNINMVVIQDKNEYSGIYYIYPADFHLRWEQPVLPKAPEDGYDFKITYGQQSGGTNTDMEAPVRMSAKLTAGIGSNERAFVKVLLKALKPNFVDIRYLELEKLETTFPDYLTRQYIIAPEKITVTSTNDLNNDITLSWRTNADTKEFIQTALMSREGISANVTLKPKDTQMQDYTIPATINLADTRSFGKMSLEPVVWRNRNWKNTTPYPLQLKYLHVLKKHKTENSLIVYSWSMNNVEIPLGGEVAFDPSLVPLWLDNDPTVFMWLDYEVMDCKPCDATVMNAVTGGVFGNTVQQIKFTIAPAAFDTLKASYFNIYVRSKQADPKGEMMKELTVLKITNDGAKEFSTGPLFLIPGGVLDYEYRITTASTDGDFYPSYQWIKATEREVLLGKTIMKEIFKGIIPGIN